MTRVKICGITRAEDAELAIELGAWALGFIFWPRSPRATTTVPRGLRRRAELAGVFVNPTLGEVSGAVEAFGLTLVQLHGDEGPHFCHAVAQRTGARVIKAIRVGSAADLLDAERYRTDFHLLDTRRDGARGGTGTTWDWTLARRPSTVPRILSGGLDASNVAAGIAAVRPFAVDVASGVESTPGVKDPAKLRDFFWAVAENVAA